MRTFNARAFLGAFAVILAAAFAAPPAFARDYLVIANHPNTVHLIDAKGREVVRSIEIPGDGAPKTNSVTPHGHHAYVLTNHNGSVSGINLKTGEEDFRADFSHGDMRVRAISAMTVSGDGDEVWAFLSPVKLMPAEYKVQDPYIAVYNVADGVGAEPARKIDAPRGIMQLASSPNGKRIYAFGYDTYIYDSQTGEQIGFIPLRSWDREPLGQPDLLTKWLAPEVAGIYTASYIAPRTDMDLHNPFAWYTGVFTLDLATGKYHYNDFERAGPFPFAYAVDPRNKDILYGVYLNLTKIDLGKDVQLDEAGTNKVIGREALPHTYYNINIASDGSEVYLGGTMDDIAVYGTDKLEPRAVIQLPNEGDQSLSYLRLVQWEDEEEAADGGQD